MHTLLIRLHTLCIRYSYAGIRYVGFKHSKVVRISSFSEIFIHYSYVLSYAVVWLHLNSEDFIWGIHWTIRFRILFSLSLCFQFLIYFGWLPFFCLITLFSVYDKESKEILFHTNVINLIIINNFHEHEIDVLFNNYLVHLNKKYLIKPRSYKRWSG